MSAPAGPLAVFDGTCWREQRSKSRYVSAMLGLVQHAGNDGSAFRPDRTGLDHAAFAVASRCRHGRMGDTARRRRRGALRCDLDPVGCDLELRRSRRSGSCRSSGRTPEMLAGFDHVAVLTADLERFVEFYSDVFGAEVEGRLSDDGPRDGRLADRADARRSTCSRSTATTRPRRQTPIFGRGRLDHFAFRATSIDQFDEFARRADAARVQRRIRHRLRPGAERVLPRPRGPRARGVRRQSRRRRRQDQPAGHPLGAIPRRRLTGPNRWSGRRLRVRRSGSLKIERTFDTLSHPLVKMATWKSVRSSSGCRR